jgi:hypothetical protein
MLLSVHLKIKKDHEEIIGKCCALYWRPGLGMGPPSWQGVIEAS